MATLGVLVTVYHRIEPDQLRACLASLRDQTRPADRTVIVADGPLTPQLEEVIAEHAAADAHTQLIRLPHNQGAGPAAAAGMEAIDQEFVARLDADDIAAPTRFAQQLDYFAAHPDTDILGTALAEFHTDPTQVTAYRRLPEQHRDIARYARWNSPINNPSVMMRTDAVRRAGGYRDVHHMEDYDLFARALATGAHLHNLPEALTYFRVDDAQFDRRTGRDMLAAEARMQSNLVSYGMIGKPRAALNFLVRTAYRLLPRRALRRAYSCLFQRSHPHPLA
ncbi:glycosyltransferase [Corynebacterium uberis]|uniref:glycosyltransferase n=1 Tax=Corynebacterium uberis TaxID=2883169 RepID=UPI001D0B60A2|nr:glycosyltransferase [Corynebacterium uberis]UDL82651.1 glycosyltransferase [Corynebacterium uberis]